MHGGKNWGFPGNAKIKIKTRLSRRDAEGRTGDGGRSIGKGWMEDGWVSYFDKEGVGI